MLLSRVELPVSDVKHAAEFYRRVLDLPTQVSGEVAEVQIGPSTLRLREQPVLSGGAHHCAVTIPADRFAEAKSWLGPRATLLGRDGRDEFPLGPPWNSQSLYFTGPDAIILELIARHDLPAATSGPFTSAHLLRISEIGLAVPDVAAAVAQLQEALGLRVFGTAAVDFTAVGDLDGLLIVVRQGRPWFPTTDVSPSPGPISVDVRTTAGRRSLTLTQDGQLDVA